MTFLSALLPPRKVSTCERDAIFCFATLPVQIVPDGEGRAACGKLRLFGETFNEQVRYRRKPRLGLRGDFALLVLGLVSDHLQSFGIERCVGKARNGTTRNL